MSSDDRDLLGYWSGLAPLWRDDGAPARRGGLDRARIVAAAIELADAKGLEAVSMRRVAAKLQTGAMSLYRHVPDRDALELMMIDRTLQEPAVDERHSGDWRSDLLALADATWTLMRAHPWLPEAMMRRPPLTPHGVRGLEWALGIFDGYEISIDAKMQYVSAIHFTVMSAALNAAIEERTRTALGASDEEIMRAGSFVFEQVAASGIAPLVMRFVSEAQHLDETAQMRAGVELILDGIATRLPARAAPEAR